MAMPDVGPPTPKSSLHPAQWALIGLVLAVFVALVAAVGWSVWGDHGSHKTSQAAAKDEVTRALDSMVQATGASRQGYTSGVALQHCDNGVGGYDGWQVYSQGEFAHQTRDGAAAMASSLSAYLRRAGYSDVKQTIGTQTVRVEGTKGDIKAVLYFGAVGAGDSINITAATGCDIVPDPAVATGDRVIIG